MTRLVPNDSKGRSAFVLFLRSLLGLLWFGFWFFIVFPGGLLYLTGSSLLPPAGMSRLAGLALIAVALMALVPPVVTFVRRGGGTPVPLDPSPILVATGCYERVRNPMYTAYLAIVLGEAVLYRSWILLAYTTGFALLTHGYVVLVEERTLHRRFGASYERYRDASGRWLPPRRTFPLDVRFSSSTTRNSRGIL